MSILKGYRPSSALQAMFSVYLGVFSVCLQHLIWTCFIVRLSKWALYDNNSGPHIKNSRDRDLTMGDKANQRTK